MTFQKAEPSTSEPSISTVKFVSMLKHIVGIILIHTSKLILAFGLVLATLFLLLSEQSGVVLNNLGNGFVRPNLANFSFNQMEPLMVFDQSLSLWTRYTMFVKNVLTGNFGLSPFNIAANTPLSELLGFRWVRSLLLFGLVMLAAVSVGKRLQKTFHKKTNHKLWACILVSLALPGWVLVFLWLFGQVFDNFPRVGQGPVEHTLNTNLFPLIFVLGIGLLLAWGVLQISKRLWASPTTFLHNAIGVVVFLAGLLTIPNFFEPDTQRILFSLFLFTVPPVLILFLITVAMYLLFVGGRFFGAHVRHQPGWGLFISLTVMVQIFVETAFNWRGVGGSFYDISFSTPRWRMIVGALIGIALWLLVAHWIRAMIQNFKRGSDSKSYPHQTSLVYHHDDKLMFLTKALGIVLVILFFVYPYVTELFGWHLVWERVLHSAVVMLEYTGLAALIATVTGVLILSIDYGLKQLRWKWISQGVNFFASGWLGMPWLLLLVFWFYLSLPINGIYPLYQLSLIFGFGFWPISFFMLQSTSQDDGHRSMMAIFKQATTVFFAAFFLVMGLALALQMLVGMVEWRPDPNIIWGQEVRNGYTNEVLGVNFQHPFWVTMIVLSLLKFVCYLLALSLRGVGQSRSLP